MSAAEVLSKARDVLAEKGWHQGSGENRATGAVCAGRAIYIAAGSDKAAAIDTYEFVTKAVRLEGWGHIPDWNDADGRTYEDVVLALKQAEELAVERGM